MNVKRLHQALLRALPASSLDREMHRRSFDGFSLRRFGRLVLQEIEKLEEQISDIKAEIEKYKGQGVNTDNQRKKILKVGGILPGAFNELAANTRFRIWVLLMWHKKPRAAEHACKHVEMFGPRYKMPTMIRLQVQTAALWMITSPLDSWNAPIMFHAFT
jgi:hypothetical protein